MQYLSKLKANFVEVYTTILIMIGIPFLVFIYLDFKAAVTVGVIIQIICGVLALRSAK